MNRSHHKKMRLEQVMAKIQRHIDALAKLAVLRKKLLLFLLAFTMPTHPPEAYAGDNRFGVDTHFQQGWSTSLIPSIKALGVGWIRDDYQGTFTGNTWNNFYATFTPAPWIVSANKAGLKVALILSYFTSNTVVEQYAVAMARSGYVQAIEMVNEPNNVPIFAPPSQGGSDANLQRLVTLTNDVAQAVHEYVGLNICQVIGLDEQGSEIIYMLGLKPVISGLVYHPYYQTLNDPGSVYEPPYFSYAAWINAVRAATKLPLWETEWGWRGSPTDTSNTEAEQTSRILARLALTQSLRIEHTFIYEFKDNGTETFGLCDNAGNPKPAYYAVQNFIATLPK